MNSLYELYIIPILVICIYSASALLAKIPPKYCKNFDSLSRNSPLDSLRGILALSVLSHHFYITYIWKVTGKWSSPNNNILDNLGAIPVSFFFLITGYLFINKIKKNNINWKSLYISRIRRILPLYLFVSSIVILITLISISPQPSLKHILEWISGWLIFRGGSLEDFKSSLIIASVNWSLLYEWGFYFSLPIIHLIFNKKMNFTWLTLFTTLLFIIIFIKTNKFLYCLFIFSYFSIISKNIIKEILEKYMKYISILIITLLIYCFTSTKAYSINQQVIISIIFIFITNSNNSFKILQSRGVKILGDISYSIYLLHGLILYINFTILNYFNFKSEIIYYYLVFPVIFTLTILVSLLSYKYIELPFLKRKAE
ncbi:acyltransferase [Acinetobacter sp. ME22]|uniref:acyltransferase family protein n=1 Tax=Acinetobacter sp. ME22 TaxID=2904802 RepID=UPI001EDA23E6|nr:acyltransferase [Acinetobacter sp. ME22]MCG2573601.1 acyltransferase [Acinetobacter sp. ME22]